MKTADVYKVCNRFRDLRSKSGRAITDQELSQEELAAVLDISLADAAPLFKLLLEDVEHAAGSQQLFCDFRLLLVAMAGLTKAKTVDRMRFAALLLDDAGTNKLTVEQIALVLRANALLVSESPPLEELHEHARELVTTFAGDDKTSISHDGFLEIVRTRPGEIFLEGVPPSMAGSAASTAPSSAAPTPRRRNAVEQVVVGDAQDVALLLTAHGINHLSDWITQVKGIASLDVLAQLTEDELKIQGLKPIAARQFLRAANATVDAKRRQIEADMKAREQAEAERKAREQAAEEEAARQREAEAQAQAAREKQQALIREAAERAKEVARIAREEEASRKAREKELSDMARREEELEQALRAKEAARVAREKELA